MNALQSMMQATARVRRDGVESEIPAEQLVAGDVVVIAAGDEVPADGRIVTSSALQIDESALTGESVPADKDAATLPGGQIGPGEQSNMAFMHTPVTHGSAVVVVTATGSGTEVGKIAHMLSGTAREETPAHPADEHPDAVDRGGSRDHDHHVRPRPEPGPIVDDAVQHGRGVGDRRDSPRLAHGRPGGPLARQRGVGQTEGHRQGPAICRDSRVHVGDQLRQDRHPDHESDDRGRGRRSQRPVRHHGQRLQPGGHHQPPGRQDRHPRGRHPPLRGGQRHQAGRRQGGGRSDRGRPAGAGPQGRGVHRCHPRRASPAGHPALRPQLQADGHVQPGQGRRGPRRGALLRQGGGAGGNGSSGHSPLQRHQHPLGRRAQPAGPATRPAHGRGRSARHGRRLPGSRRSQLRSPGRPAGPGRVAGDDQPGRHGRPAP